MSNEEGATSKEGVAGNQTSTEREKNKKRGESKTKKGEKHENIYIKTFFYLYFLHKLYK